MRNSTVPRTALPVAILIASSMIATLGWPRASGNEPGPLHDAALVRPAPAEQRSMLVQGKGKPDITPSKALQHDLKFYAEKARLDYEDLLARHRGINSFDGVMTDLEKRMPDKYVRAGLSGPKHAGDYWIQLTTRPSEQLIERLRSLPVDVEVNYGAPASSHELAALAAALTKPMADRSDIIRSASTAYDPSSHVVTLEYIPVAGLAVASADQAARAAVAYAASTFQHNRLPVEVVLDRQDQAPPAVPEITVQGGRTLRSQGARHCTAGFTARRNGHRGVLTARHCNNRLRYQRRRAIRRAVQTSYVAADLQWHRTRQRHSTNRQFRATGRRGRNDRTVHFVRNAPRGSTVCHWGYNTGYDCSEVTRLDRCIVSDGVRRCGIDSTRADVSGGGDSGGPWFLGRTARGIHHGATPGRRSHFTRVSRVYQHLSARVLQR